MSQQVQLKFEITLTQEEYDRVEERAEAAGLSKAEYGRRRFRTGELVWNSGEIDTELLRDMSELGSIEKEETPETSHTNTSQGNSNRPASTQEDLNAILLRNVPHKDSGDAITDEELMDVIFGTAEEREAALQEGIKELFGDKITRRHDGKLVRVGDENEQ